MKKRIAGMCVVAGVALVLTLGCENGVNDLPSDGVVSTTLSIGASTVDLSVAARSLGDSDRVYFRSSDIEMWQIESVEDIGTLTSSKYVRGGGDDVDYSQNHSLEYIIGDSTASLVFSPDMDMTVGVDRADLNPTWSSDVGAFIAAGKTTISAMRLDIGGGHVTFEIGGEERVVFTADGQDNNGIDGNSIFFVDRQFLTKPMLITRSMESEIISGSATAASLDITDEQFAVAQVLHTSSNWYDGETPIDVNGALIVPMDPVDIGDYDPATETLDIIVSWPIENAVHERDGGYFMDRRVGETCFDFDVSLEVTPK
jgi:hypothetical protein